MVSVNPPESRNRLVKTAKSLIMQPILFIQALPYVTAQLSVYGLTFIKRPVVWMALGFHGILLLLPAVDLSAPKVEEVVETELEEELTIEAVSLSDILAPAEPIPPPPEEPQAPPPEAAPPPAVVAPPVFTEVPEQLEEIIEEQDEDPLDAFEDEFEEEFEGEEQSFAFDPAQQAAFSSSLSQLIGVDTATGTSNFDITNQWLDYDPSNATLLRFREQDMVHVPDPGAFFTPESLENGTHLPFPGVGFNQIARNTGLVRREGLGESLISAGMTEGEESTYGDHLLLGIYNAEGNPVNYVSLVDLQGTTLVFTWPNDPRLN